MPPFGGGIGAGLLELFFAMMQQSSSTTTMAYGTNRKGNTPGGSSSPRITLAPVSSHKNMTPLTVHATMHAAKRFCDMVPSQLYLFPIDFYFK